MFPGGVNPDDVRRMQEQVDMAERYYESVGEIMQRSDVRRHVVNLAELNAHWERAMRGVPLEEIAQRLATVGQALNSSGMQSSLEAINRTNELAVTRFGSEGLEAAQQIFESRVRPTSSFASGFERAERKIREGRADEVLEEAAALISGEDARLTLEQADKDALLEAARQEPEEEAPKLEIRAGVDVETVIAELANLSEEEFDALEYYSGQIIRVALFAVTVGVVVASPALGLTQASGVLGSMMAFWGFVNAARARKKEQNKDS